ncbi:hypothetical protein Poly51_62640 [Rubripirellula tenax]|uniref:Uncharacterized protein n=1 Tax=Rubripirellula tenax TaxID=2528015 RepID=A0A5C6E8Q5_9BACT|nr:hypothetical protein Poly51_62640 [Rubripirellula tenax]
MACFTADCTVTNDGGPIIDLTVDCEISSFLNEPHYHDETKSYLASALEHIERGLGYALLHRRHGLRAVLTDLRLHPIDYQPLYLTLHTYYYARRQLEMLDDKDRIQHSRSGEP